MNFLNTVIPIGFAVIIALIWKISDQLTGVNQRLESIRYKMQENGKREVS
jgi:hypothetical protein